MHYFDSIEDIRTALKYRLDKELFTDSRFGKTIQIIDASFSATEPEIVYGANFMQDDETYYKNVYEPIANPQIERAIALLKSDINTRQAIITLSDRHSYYTNNYLCTSSMQAIVDTAENKLYYIVTMRSQDISHFKNDLIWQKQQAAKILNSVNKYYDIDLQLQIDYHCNSLHIYSADFDKIK